MYWVAHVQYINSSWQNKQGKASWRILSGEMPPIIQGIQVDDDINHIWARYWRCSLLPNQSNFQSSLSRNFRHYWQIQIYALATRLSVLRRVQPLVVIPTLCQHCWHKVGIGDQPQEWNKVCTAITSSCRAMLLVNFWIKCGKQINP